MLLQSFLVSVTDVGISIAVTGVSIDVSGVSINFTISVSKAVGYKCHYRSQMLVSVLMKQVSVLISLSVSVKLSGISVNIAMSVATCHTNGSVAAVETLVVALHACIVLREYQLLRIAGEDATTLIVTVTTFKTSALATVPATVRRTLRVARF